MAGMTSVSRTADTTDPAPELRQRWAVTVAKARGTKNPTTPDPAPYADNLLSRWREPQRRYHTVDHLTAVLYRIDELAAARRRLARRPVGGLVPRRRLPPGPLRERGAQRGPRRTRPARAGHRPARTAEVARLVRLTVTHDPAPDDPDGEVLCDADLAVLAGSPDEYAAYAAAVRDEYAFVPDPDFLAGRSAVLSQLLALPRLFRTPRGYDRWEHLRPPQPHHGAGSAARGVGRRGPPAGAGMRPERGRYRAHRECEPSYRC